MRLNFPNTTRPKKASKHIAGLLSLPLSAVQQAVARSTGYRDWHDLECACGKDSPSHLDQDLTPSEFVARQTRLAVALSQALSIPSGDAQYVLSGARLSGDRAVTLEEQIAVRLSTWRELSLPEALPRHQGAVGRLKTSGRHGEAVILRHFGRPTEVISHYAVTTVAEFEYVSPRSQPPLFLPMRLYLPYGYWVESDGARVIFSRDYNPMWRLCADGSIQRLEPWLRIGFTQQVFLWDDGLTPWHSMDLRRHLEELLGSWSIHGLPILADALPLLVHAPSGNGLTFSNAAVLLQRERERQLPHAVA